MMIIFIVIVVILIGLGIIYCSIDHDEILDATFPGDILWEKENNLSSQYSGNLRDRTGKLLSTKGLRLSIVRGNGLKKKNIKDLDVFYWEYIDEKKWPKKEWLAGNKREVIVKDGDRLLIRDLVGYRNEDADVCIYDQDEELILETVSLENIIGITRYKLQQR